MPSIRPGRAVLVVEDAISVRSMLSEFFIGCGYEVLHARHPDVALKRLNTSGASIDAVILDVHLDDNRSGLEVLELIRRNRAYLLYKQQGPERIFERLEGIVKPLVRPAA